MPSAGLMMVPGGYRYPHSGQVIDFTAVFPFVKRNYRAVSSTRSRPD